MELRPRLELSNDDFADRRFDHFSLRSFELNVENLVRGKGIEPLLSVCKTNSLPLQQPRIKLNYFYNVSM